MKGFHVGSLRGEAGYLEIELSSEPLDREAIETSVRELRRLVYELKYRQPPARRLVREIYARLRGLDSDDAFDRFDMGDARADRIGDELLRAARAGRLVVRPRRLRAAAVPLEAPSEAVLGPDSGPGMHAYRILVLDDTGAPVPGAALTLDIAGDERDGRTDAAGKVAIDTTASDIGTCTLTNRDELVDKLWQQWTKPVTDKAPPGDRVTQAAVTRPIAPLHVPADWLVTLVLTRPSIWRVRMVGMLFDADKCFIIPQALDGVRSIVAMHQAHPAAKVLIVGHEEGDEVTGGIDMALARAKALSAYLTNKPDDWLRWFDADKSRRQRWGLTEVQRMLSALSGPDGRPFYDGTSPGVMDDKTAAALRAFQTANGLAVDGQPGPDTRKALVTTYMGLEDTSLATDVQPVTHGCTGHTDDTLADDGLQPDDRRMEVLFFDADIQPAPSGDTSPPGAPEYPAWKMRTVETVDFENHGIHVQIVDTAKQPVAFATVHLDGPTTGDTTADEHGLVSFWGLVAGDYTLTATTQTGRPVTVTKIAYPTAKTSAGVKSTASKEKVGQASQGAT